MIHLEYIRYEQGIVEKEFRFQFFFTKEEQLPSMRFAYELSLNERVIVKTEYGTQECFRYPISQQGIYSLRVSVDTGEETVTKKYDQVIYRAGTAWIYGAEQWKELCQEALIQETSGSKAECMIIDCLPEAVKWFQTSGKAVRTNEKLRQQMREGFLHQLIQVFERPVYLLRWELWPAYEQYRDLHWILEEFYDCCRERFYQLKEFTILPMLNANQKGGELIASIYSTAKQQLCHNLYEMIRLGKNYDIENAEVTCELQENHLCAKVDVNGKKPTDRYLYYLISEHKVVEKTNWIKEDSYCFHLKQNGIYLIRAYLLREGCKASKYSAPVSYFDDAYRKEFKEYLEDTEKSPLVDQLNTEISYVPQKAPLCDICIVTTNKNVKLPPAPPFYHVAAVRYGNYQTQVYASVKPGTLSSGTHFLLSGVMVYQNRIREGMEQIPDNLPENELFGQTGHYACVSWNADQLVLGTDYFAFKRWFYYQDDDYFLAANQYHLLLLAVRSLGIKLRLDEKKACVTLMSAEIQMLSQNFSRKMDLLGVSQITADQQFYLDSGGWHVMESDLGKVQKERHIYHEEEYQNGLRRVKQELSDHCEMYLKDPRYQEIVVDLTGGMDSRLVYSAMLNVKGAKEKIRLNTHDVKGSRDLPTALKVNRSYGIPFTTAKEVFTYLPLKEADNLNRSYYLGTYYSRNIVAIRREKSGIVNLNGACGEILARPYISRKYLSTNLCGIQDYEKFTEEFYCRNSEYILSGNRSLKESFLRYFGGELKEQSVTSPMEAIESMYLTYRHAYHFDTIMNLLGSDNEMPLQSKTLYQLYRMSYRVHKSIRLELDLLINENPALVSIPFDYEQDNADAMELRNERRNLQYDRNYDADLPADTKEWQQANQIRASRRVTHMTDAKEYQKLRDILYENLQYRLKELLRQNSILCETIGIELYHHLKKLGRESRYTSVWYNKVSSLLDQYNIFDRI